VCACRPVVAPSANQAQPTLVSGAVCCARAHQARAPITADECSRLVDRTLGLPQVELLLAMPRPKVLRRLLPVLAELGVHRLTITPAERVEKVYFASHVLRPAEVWSRVTPARQHLDLKCATACRRMAQGHPCTSTL
jgi:hypothetical protein